MPDKPISPRRQRLIDAMTARRYGEKAQKAYVRHVRSFAALLGRSSDMATSDDLRRFQLHMAQQQISAGSINAAIAALRFFFTRDARTARSRPPSHDRAQAAQGSGRSEPGRGSAAARSRARPQGTRPRSASPPVGSIGPSPPPRIWQGSPSASRRTPCGTPRARPGDRHPSARAERRHSRDPGAARTRQARDGVAVSTIRDIKSPLDRLGVNLTG
jgi:hypothetical protein